jgi:hypothetical protein
MTDASPTPVPAKGLLDRIIGVITSPKATFEAVVAHPRPVGVLFVCALIIGLSTGLPQLTERGRQAAIDQSVEMMERMFNRPLTEQEMTGIERQASFGAYGQLIGSFFSLPIMSLLLAAVYFVIFNAILGGSALFKQVLAVVTHSWVIPALGAAISAPVMYLQGTMTMAGPFNLGVLVPMLDENSFLAKLLGFTNIFTIWVIITVAIGFAVLYRRKTQNIAIGLALAYLLIVGGGIAAWNAITGS